MSPKRANSNTNLEWYRVLLIIIGAFGIILAFINWYSSGSDIPNGLLTILSLIISAALGPNAVSTVASSLKKTLDPNSPPEPTYTNPNQTINPNQPNEYYSNNDYPPDYPPEGR